MKIHVACQKCEILRIWYLAQIHLKRCEADLFYPQISVWILMPPNNPIKMWSLNHYRLEKMLINNSCSLVSYFDKYRTDKKHRTRELNAFATVTTQTIQEQDICEFWPNSKKKLLSSCCKAVSCQQSVNNALLITYISNRNNISKFFNSFSYINQVSTTGVSKSMIGLRSDKKTKPEHTWYLSFFLHSQIFGE